MPYLRAMLAFEWFGRTGSMTDAAVALGVTTGAISQHIRHLEEVLGVKLVHRHGNSVRLTLLGHTYHAQLATGFGALRSAQDIIRAAKSSAVLTVSSLRSLATKWLGPRVFDWQGQNKDAKVRLIGDAAEPDLDREDIDYRVTYGPNAARHAQTAVLFTDYVVPVCTPQLLRDSAPRNPAELLHVLPLIGIEWPNPAGQSPNWTQWSRHVGLEMGEVVPHMTFSFSNAALDATLYGKGCALGQFSMVSDDIAAGRLIVPFDIRMRMPEPYYLAWSASAFEKPHSRTFHRWLTALGKAQDEAYGAGKSGTPDRQATATRSLT
nr:LysR substrate-binding domain-containing protein [Ancylobacter tetraedralis]